MPPQIIKIASCNFYLIAIIALNLSKKIMRTFSLFVTLLYLLSNTQAQIRIDSSFAFSTNPAKQYSIFVPSQYNPSVPNPMIVAFHPLDLTRWNSISWCDTLKAFSEANNVITVCPDGGPNGIITDQIDYDFTTALIDSMKHWYNVDDRRIYALGFSVGGQAVYEYGLNNAETFGGFIPVGAAISGTSFVSSVIHNAGGRAFYVVHGSLDAPTSRFFPIVNSLLANCALLDSNLMPGIGHTIDFPNRNAILSEAYEWVDSVNTTPRTASFSLAAPPHLSTIIVKGFHDYQHHFTWQRSPLEDSCGVLKYEVLVDLPFGDFSNPLLVMNSNNGGLDTALSMTNETIDSLLTSYNIPLNGSLGLDWVVRSNINNHHADTAKFFRIIFTRKKLGFDILTPLNNIVVNLNNGSNRTFDWEDLSHYTGFQFHLIFDELNGDFSNPVASFTSGLGGSSSNLNLSHEDLYYQLMFLKGMNIDDTITLKWAVEAVDANYRELSASERVMTFIRKNVGFELFLLPDNSLINSKKDVDYLFIWDSIPLDSITYELRFDTLNVDLQNSASIVLASDVDSVFARKNMTYEILDSVMDIYGIKYLDTLHGQWTVRAIYPGGDEYSLTTYNVSIVRAHPVGLAEGETLKEIQIFPNPSSDKVTIQNLNRQYDRFKLYGSNAGLVLDYDVSEKDELLLDVSMLNGGIYLYELSSKAGIRSGSLLISR